MPQFKNDTVLIVGSGPNAVDCTQWSGFDQIIAINNAWRIRPDWNALIYPEDFPKDRHPPTLQPSQRRIEADQFVPAQNAYGGFVYAGATMAFTAGYWALHALRPRVMAFIGCDMVYAKTGPTHFYGTGAPDPLRDDISLMDLGASSARLALMAAAEGTRCVNLSQDDSALLFERATPADLAHLPAARLPNPSAYGKALAAEAKLGYFVQNGRVWEEAHRFSPALLLHLHAMWRAAYGAKTHMCAAA